MQKLASLLQKLLGNEPKLKEELFLEQIRQAWPKVAGDIFQQAEPVEYRSGKLTLITTSPVWAQQIQFFRGKIIEKYREVLPHIHLAEVKTKTGKIISAVQIEKKEELTEAEKKEVSFLVEEITDQSQKEVLTRIVEKDFLWKKNDKRKICPLCGRRYFGKEMCWQCYQEDLQQTAIKIAQFLDTTPWAKLEDVQAAYPEIHSIHYYRVKNKLREQTKDRIQKIYYELLKKHTNKLEKNFQREILRYVMLKTGLTPDKINDKILKEQVGEKLFKIAYPVSKKTERA